MNHFNRDYMKQIYYILLTILLSSCNYHHGYIDGDVKIFKGSKVFDLAKWVKIGYVPKIESILENQELDINELSPIGRWSVLQLAVFDNSPRVVACLMKYGADPFLPTCSANTPFDIAIMNCKTACLSEMIKYGRIDTIPETCAISALICAYKNCDKAMTLLKQKGVQKKDPGFVVYDALVYRRTPIYDEKKLDSIELMELGLTFDDSLPIRRPDLVLSENHKGKTISQIIREEDIQLTKEEVRYLQIKKGVDVMHEMQ